MTAVRAVFCRRHHPGALFIRAVSWSSWSHVAPIIDDEEDTVIDATFPHGVGRHSLAQLLEISSEKSVRSFQCPNPLAAFDFARAQIGKPYDTVGMLGLGLHRDWQEDDAWFCSELLEAMLAAGGNQRFVNQIHRVTPQHSWMVR